MLFMKMSLQFWNLKWGNKGFIFTLDMIIAMTFTIIILILANYYVRSTENPLTKLQMEKTGSDIAALLDNLGILDTLSDEEIEEDLEDILPVNYDIKLSIITKKGITLNIGSALPDDKYVISGKRVFVVTQNNIIADEAFVQYWIWLK